MTGPYVFDQKTRRRCRIFVDILLIVLLCINIRILHAAQENEADEEGKVRSLDLFDANYLALFEGQIKNFSIYEKQELLSKLGKISFYIRLYRSWIRSPHNGRRSFEKYFPEPHARFHPWVYDDCSKDILTCIRKIYGSLQNRTQFLFPQKDQQIESFNLHEDLFVRSVSNGMFSYDVSVSYLMCFLTKNRLSLLSLLPFCSYGVGAHHKKVWPSEIFKDYKSRSELFIPGEKGSEPIDHFLGQDYFQCADESFCPDPCCGRLTGRNPSTNNTEERFCENSVCLENVAHQTSSRLAFNDKSGPHKNSHPTHSCFAEAIFNDDLVGMIENRWNLSCACLTENGTRDPGRIYRFDVRQCVDVDECLFKECGEFEKCVNTVGNHKCVCKLGYLRDLRSGECHKIEFKHADLWHGKTEPEK